MAWAVNGFSEEIRWNHLSGDAVIVNYHDHTAWEYNTWNFPLWLSSEDFFIFYKRQGGEFPSRIFVRMRREADR